MKKDLPLNFKYFAKIFLVLLSVVFFAYVSLNWAIGKVIHSKKEVIVPNIIGKSPLSALEELSKKNLAMQLQGYEFNSSVPVGMILRQKPQAGITVREGRIVKVIISQGGESVFVPNVVGIPLRNAEILLRQRQLMLGQVSEAYSTKFPKGVVMSQEPNADSQVSKNTYVNLLVSAGLPPSGVVLMPEFRQKDISDFEKWAQSIKAKYRIEKDRNSVFPRGTIIDQKPDCDAVIDDNTEIVITISDSSSKVDETKIPIVYNVPKGSGSKNVRIVAVSNNGKTELFNGIKEPGSRVELMVTKESIRKIRIYLNGTLVEERSFE